MNHQGQHQLDPVLFSLLQAIDELGSLKLATDNVGVSYRFAWGLLNKWQDVLGQPLVKLERGRGANLSQVGQLVLNAKHQLDAKFSPELVNFANHIKQDLSQLLNSQITDRLTIYASHGLAINSLREHLNQQSDLQLDLHFHGSIESLTAMNQGQCDIAGFHIPEGELGQSLLKHYQHLLDEQHYQLVHVVKRNQGLICSPSCSQQLSTLPDLSNSSLRFINRQQNSGTRLLFDQLLKQQGIKASSINGYQHEEFTHMAVAAMIASGAADVGFGIAPIAEKFNLRFVPMVWEYYCLAIPNTLMDDLRVKAILSALKSNDFQQPFSQYSGYQSTQSGELTHLTELVR
jgi:molybdate transport repressor ModE-like protein